MEGSDYEDKCSQWADDMGRISNHRKRKDMSKKEKCYDLSPFFSLRLIFSFSHNYSSSPRHRPADYTCLRNHFLPSASSDFYDSSPLTH